MLDRDGRFLRYIIPDGGIEDPRAVCMIGDGEMIVGECLTGLAKTVKFLEEQTEIRTVTGSISAYSSHECTLSHNV